MATTGSAHKPFLSATLLRDISILVAASVFASAGVNLVRKQLPWVAPQEYEIVVPCPEPSGEITEIDPSDPVTRQPGSLWVDARSNADFSAWHAPNAISITYDFLDPTSESQIRTVAKSHALRVIVYGDGQDPDCGRELGKELSGKGIKNVHVIRGGAPALNPSLKAGAP